MVGRRWRCKKCNRVYIQMLDSVNCDCPPMTNDRIMELAIYFKEAFGMPQLTVEIAQLLGWVKPKPGSMQETMEDF